MFGRLPAYGLYCRHVDGLLVNGLHCSYREKDARPMLVLDDVSNAVLDSLSAAATTGDFPVLWVMNSKAISVQRALIPSGTKTFLAVEDQAETAKSITLTETDARNAKTPLLVMKPGGLVAGDLPLFKETQPGIVNIEATAMRLVPPMAITLDANIASGKCISVPGGGGREQGAAKCRFEVSADGEYVVWVRASAATSEEDTFYASVDHGSLSLSDIMKKGAWAWDHVRNRVGEKTLVNAWTIYTLTRGEHTLLIRNRESGARIERIIIVRKGMPFEPK